MKEWIEERRAFLEATGFTRCASSRPLTAGEQRELTLIAEIESLEAIVEKVRVVDWKSIINCCTDSFHRSIIVVGEYGDICVQIGKLQQALAAYDKATKEAK